MADFSLLTKQWAPVTRLGKRAALSKQIPEICISYANITVSERLGNVEVPV